VNLVALGVLAFLSIFSAKYRKWAKEAFNCVTRRLTLRPCNTGFNDKVRATVTSKLMTKHAGLARFTHKHFESISWVFTIVMFVSLAYTAYGFYNLAVLGTCDPANPENCVFNPGGDPNRVICDYEDLHPEASVLTIGGFSNIESAEMEARPKVMFFGTSWCPHCAWERPIFNLVADKFGDKIEKIVVEIDTEPDDDHIVTFNHYSEEGYIPAVIIGGKYFRIGSGEQFGAEAEKDILTAILCKSTNNPIDACNEPEVAELISQI